MLAAAAAVAVAWLHVGNAALTVVLRRDVTQVLRKDARADLVEHNTKPQGDPAKFILSWASERQRQLRIRTEVAQHAVSPQQPSRAPKRLVFLVRSGGNTSKQRLAAIRSTWARALDQKYTATAGKSSPISWSASLVVLAGNEECKRLYGDNARAGLTCLEARGELELMKSTDFDWLMVIDDDVYVNVKNLMSWLSSVQLGEKAVWGLPGCGECGDKKKHLTGLCGGPGYVISRENLARMVESSGPGAFLEDFLTGPDAKWCDVRFACVAQHHGLQLREAPGFYGWGFLSEAEEDRAVRSTEVPPVTFHYADPSRMRSLYGKFQALSPGSLIMLGASAADYERQKRAFLRSVVAARAGLSHSFSD